MQPGCDLRRQLREITEELEEQPWVSTIATFSPENVQEVGGRSEGYRPAGHRRRRRYAGHVSTAYIPLRPVPYPGPPGADNEVMQPRFGIVTRVIAAVFALAGIGAAMAILGTGDASDGLVLLLLAAGFLVLAVGLWAESTWAWWAGAAVVVLTVLLSRVLNVPGGAGLVWLGTVVGFVVSGFQGWRDQVRVRPAK